MPQFDFENVFIPQLFWLGLFFIILYFGVIKTTLPRLGKVMTERENTIEGDLALARAAKDSADELGESYRAQLAANREAARAAITAAKEDAALEGEKRLKAADSRLDKKVAEAEARIAAAKAESGESLRQVAAESAQAIVAKLTGQEPGIDAAYAKVDAAMAAKN